MSRFVERRLTSEFWQSHRFDALPGQYALGCHPQESYVVATSDKMIGKRLYSRGAFDLQKLERAFEILRVEQPDAMPEVLLDVGANVGSICIPAVKRGWVKRAIAFEPDAGNFRLLRINVLLNAIEDGVECHEVALGAVAGVATLAFNPDNHGDHRIVGDVLPGIGSREVAVHTLDSYLPQTGRGAWMVWLDVQGFEPEVLAGARRAIAAGWPIVMEFTPEDMVRRGTFGTLMDLIRQSPYTRFFDLDKPRAESTARPIADLEQVTEELRRRESFTDLLFLPDPAHGRAQLKSELEPAC
jgi:FkbM family methyltransferase